MLENRRPAQPLPRLKANQMQETSLHSALKNWYTQPGDSQEMPVDGFLVDVVRGDVLIEIQTRHFHALKSKLDRLLENHRVRVVHPIAQEKWIVRLPGDRNLSTERRRSPKHGRLEHIFVELVRFPQLISHPNFSLEVVLIREEEIRRHDGRGSWRRKGWSIADRKLLEVVDQVVLEQPADFRLFLPASLPHTFTSRDLGLSLGIPRGLAQKALYCLTRMDLVAVTGSQGRSRLYCRNSELTYE